MKYSRCIVLFHSTNHVFFARDLLKEKGIECKMTSIPRHLSSDCGYCLEVPLEKEKEVQRILTLGDAAFDTISKV